MAPLLECNVCHLLSKTVRPHRILEIQICPDCSEDVNYAVLSKHAAKELYALTDSELATIRHKRSPNIHYRGRAMMYLYLQVELEALKASKTAKASVTENNTQMQRNKQLQKRGITQVLNEMADPWRDAILGDFGDYKRKKPKQVRTFNYLLQDCLFYFDAFAYPIIYYCHNIRASPKSTEI